MCLSKLLKKELYRDIVKFFHENQASIDTPRGIATWIKAERAIVKKALDTLVKLGVLTGHNAPSMTGYSYTRNKKRIKKIGKKLKDLQ